MATRSRYKTVNMPVVGGSYQSRAIPFSAQRSLNLYPESHDSGMPPSVMRSWPGLSIKYVDASGNPVIASYVWGGVFYTITGGVLRKYSDDLTSYTAIGSIDSAGFARASISDNGEVMVIVAGASAWEYDGSTLSKITSLTQDSIKVQFLNERFYILGADGGVAVSDVLSTNFDPANVFYGRSTPENTATFHIFNQIVYLFDSNSIEPWEDVGAGAPPTSRINNGIIQGVGCNSVLGIAATENFMYFIGSDGHAYRVSGFRSEDITAPAVADHFRSLDTSRVVCDFVSVGGSKFIIFNFTADDEVWCFSETSGSWFEIAGSWYDVAGFSFYQGEWIAGEVSRALLWALDESSELVPSRERVLATISGDAIGEPGVMLEMSKIRLSMETGNALIPTGSAANPQIMLIPSFDGGYTFGKPIILDIGQNGDYTLPVEVHMMQQFRRATFIIRLTSFYGSYSIFSASIDVRKAGY